MIQRLRVGYVVLGLLFTAEPAEAQHRRELDGQLNRVLPAADGAVVATGEVDCVGFLNGFGARKFDSLTGNQIWCRIPGAAAVNDLAIVSGGDVAIVGRSFNVALFNGATGAVRWHLNLDGAPPHIGDDARGVAGDLDGNVIAAGALLHGTFDFTVIKLDKADGTELWRYEVDAGNATTAAVGSDGNVVAAGSLSGEFSVLKIDNSSGGLIWQVVIEDILPSEDSNDVAFELVLVDDDPIVVGRWSNDYLVVRLDGATGDELWRRTIDDNPADFIDELYVTADTSGDVFVNGVFLGSGGSAVGILKLDGATGTELWHAAPPLGGDRVKHVDVLPNGDPVVTGTLTARLDATTGAVLWANEFAPGEQVAIDTSGNAFVVDSRESNLSHILNLDADNGDIGPVMGQTLKMKDSPPGTARRSLTTKWRGPEIRTPAPGGPGDPRLFGGGVRLMNPLTGESASFPLPASGWSGLGKPSGSLGYSYKDKGTHGPCHTVKIQAGKVAKIGCLGSLGPMPFSLDEVEQDEMLVSVQLGSSRPQCSVFGGTIKRDEGWSVYSRGAFQAINSPALGFCPVP